MKKKQRKKFKVDIDMGRDVIARPPEEKDVPFILSSWLKSYRDSEFASSIPADVYFNNHRSLINHILIQENNALTLLCDSEDHDHILGFIAYNSKAPIVFYVYVKHAFRNLGLGRYMLEGIKKNFGGNVKIQCTHKARGWKNFKSLGLVYNPYLIKEITDEN